MPTNLDDIKKIYGQLQLLRSIGYGKLNADDKETFADLSRRLDNATPLLLGMVEAYQACLGSGILERLLLKESTIDQAEQQEIQTCIALLREYDEKWVNTSVPVFKDWEKLRDRLHEHLQDSQRIVYVRESDLSPEAIKYVEENMVTQGKMQFSSDDPVSLRVKRGNRSPD